MIHGDFDYSKVTIYLVGGFVRDLLISKHLTDKYGYVTPKDRDYVVVGSSPEEMLKLGYKQVGKDFPVFLHPKTGDEYALARTERKTGGGYYGFDCEWEGVTIEEDLSRRDLTINAIAVNCSKDMGKIVDIYNGAEDLKKGVLRPTSSAFKEDPVRLLRTARFLARHPTMVVSNSLLELGREMDLNGELLNLTPERVWKETEKALSETDPTKYFEFLVQFENLPFMNVFKEMVKTKEDNLYHQEDNVFVHTMMVLSECSKYQDPIKNFAALLHDIAKPYCYHLRGNAHGHDEEGVPMVEDWCRTWKVPNKYRDLAKITCKQHQKVHAIMGRGGNSWVRPKTIMKMFEDSGALKDKTLFTKMLDICESDNLGRISINKKDTYYPKEYLLECLESVLSFPKKDFIKDLLDKGKTGKVIGDMVREEQIKQIRGVQKKWKEKLKA